MPAEYPALADYSDRGCERGEVEALAVQKVRTHSIIVCIRAVSMSSAAVLKPPSGMMTSA